MTYQVVLDYITYIILDNEHINHWLIIRRYGCNYFGCVIMMMTEYEFQHLGSNLAKRIKKFNEIIEKFDLTQLKLTKELHSSHDNWKKVRNVLRVTNQLSKNAKIFPLKAFDAHWWNIQNTRLLLINTPLNSKLYGNIGSF